MKSNRKIYITHLLILTILAAFVILLLLGDENIFGSYVDWMSQHSVIPEYFRQSFYETKNFIPQFAMHLGAGQNVFNLSYHGLLSPVTLISYLFPAVSMVDYIGISSIILLVLSIWLFYIWLIKNDIRRSVSFIAAILFTCAGPLIFQSHKQVMFVSYMPFMIMALLGVDRLFAKGKQDLLIISTFLMIMTSYFFSVPGIFALMIYAIYKYLKQTDAVSVKGLFKSVLPCVLSVLIAAIMSAVLLLPAFSAIIAGRGHDAGVSTSLPELLIPDFPYESVFYREYGLGITCITFFALLSFIFLSKDRAKTFLSLSIMLVTISPILRYILNGLLYTRGKVLIPFLPIAIFVAALFLEELSERKYKLRFFAGISGVMVILYAIVIAVTRYDYDLIIIDIPVTLLGIWLYKKYKKTLLLYIPIVTIAAWSVISINLTDTLRTEAYVDYIYSEDIYDMTDDILGSDDSVYRSNDLTKPKTTNNILYNRNYLQTGMYSSVFNSYYRAFYNYDLHLANATINDIALSNTSNVLFQTFMGVKYIISDKNAPAGYEKAAEQGAYRLYKNEDVYSLGFSTGELMSLSEYSGLSPIDKELAILKYIVVDRDLPDVYTSPLKKVDLDINLGEKEDGYYLIETESGKDITVPLDTALNEEVYIVNVSVKQRAEKRVTITINGIENNLSPADSAYPNTNFNFQFVVSDASDLSELQITLGPGSYSISDFEVYAIDYERVKAMGENLDMWDHVSLESDNIIRGTIDVAEDGYFATTIPYDEAFGVYVYGEKQDFEMVDGAFIGFPISSGAHDIELVYTAPLLREGKIISVIGIAMYIGVLALQFRKRKMNKATGHEQTDNPPPR